MKLTNEKTEYVVVKAGDSCLGGGRYAIIPLTDHLKDLLTEFKGALNLLKDIKRCFEFRMVESYCYFLDGEFSEHEIFNAWDEASPDGRFCFLELSDNEFEEIWNENVLAFAWQYELRITAGAAFYFTIDEEVSTNGEIAQYATEAIFIDGVI